MKLLRGLAMKWWFAVNPGAEQRKSLPTSCLLSTALSVKQSDMLQRLKEEKVFVPAGGDGRGMREAALRKLGLLRYGYLKNDETSHQITWLMKVDDSCGTPPHLPADQIAHEARLAATVGIEINAPLLLSPSPEKSPVKSPKPKSPAKKRGRGRPTKKRPRDVRVDAGKLQGELSLREEYARYALNRRALDASGDDTADHPPEVRSPAARRAPPRRACRCAFHERRVS